MTNKRTYSKDAPRYAKLHEQGMSLNAIAAQFGRTRKTIVNRIAEYRRYTKQEDSIRIEKPQNRIIPHPNVNPEPHQELPTKIYQKTKPLVIRQLTYANTDHDVFWKRYNDLKANKRFVRIFTPFDKHYPFHDADAITLSNMIIKSLGADIIVTGSDIFDFPKSSRHEPDYELNMNPNFDDSFYRIEDYYKQDVIDLNESASNAVKLFIFGNHDLRFMYMALQSNTPKFLVNRFVEFIKQDNSVHYLGIDQELLLDSVFIQHDGGTGQNVAKRMLSNDHTVHHIAGHTHRPDSATHKGLRFTAHSMVVGCHCVMPPTYQTAKGKHKTNWSQSLGMVDLDTKTGAAQMTNIMYHRDDELIYAWVGGQLFTTPITQENYL